MKRLIFPAFVTLVGVLAVVLTPTAVSAPKKLCVGGPSCYPTLQAAVDAAVDGDTIRLNPGTYAGRRDDHA